MTRYKHADPTGQTINELHRQLPLIPVRGKLAQIIKSPGILLYKLVTLHEADELSILAVLRLPREEALQKNSRKTLPTGSPKHHNQ